MFKFTWIYFLRSFKYLPSIHNSLESLNSWSNLFFIKASFLNIFNLTWLSCLTFLNVLNILKQWNSWVTLNRSVSVGNSPGTEFCPFIFLLDKIDRIYHVFTNQIFNLFETQKLNTIIYRLLKHNCNGPRQ